MRKSIALAIAALTLPLSALAADSTNWTKWSTITDGTLVQNGNSVDVTFGGGAYFLDHSSYFYDVPSSFTSPDVTNAPATEGTIGMLGGDATVHSFTFSQAVVDPVMAVFSVGQGSVPVRFVFDTDHFSVTSPTANGHWGGGTLVQAGNVVTGVEGNGLIQFKGTFTKISFTTPDYENYYGGTIGAPAAAVPEPEALVLALGGLMVVGGLARRRRI